MLTAIDSYLSKCEGNPRKSAHSKIRPWAVSRKKSPKMRPWAGFLYLRGDTCRECPQ